jgi:hypothetical protein
VKIAVPAAEGLPDGIHFFATPAGIRVGLIILWLVINPPPKF